MKDLTTYVTEAQKRECDYMERAAYDDLKAPKTLSAIEKQLLCVLCDSTDPLAQMKDYDTLIAFAYAVKDWVKTYKVKKVRYVVNEGFVRDTLKITREKYIETSPFKVDYDFVDDMTDMLDMLKKMDVVASESNGFEDAEYTWGTYEGKPAFHVRIGDFCDTMAIAI